MARNIGGFAVAVACLLAAAAWGCDRALAPDRSAVAVVETAVERVRTEQREQMQRAARLALARLRSEAVSAIARGGSAAGGGAIQAAP